MKIIAVSNGKGGVGKTTTTANLGAALTRCGLKVLLIDLDPQLSLTDFFLIDITSPDSITIKDVLLSNKIDPNVAIIPVLTNLDIIPNGEEMDAYVETFQRLKNGPFLLKSALSRIRTNYDVCLIDTPPSLSFYTDMSLIAADKILMPLKPSEVDAKATERFLTTVEAAKEINPTLEIAGIVFTMVKSSKGKQKKFVDIFKGDELEKVVLKTKIRDTVGLGVSSTKGQDIFQFDSKSIGASDYNDLALEVKTWLI